jgi:hypothetical protein
MMWDDPIVEETRRIRDEIAARHQYDLQAIGAYYQSKGAAAALQKIAAARTASGDLQTEKQMMHKRYKVTGLEVVEDYTLRVRFDDGTEQVIDFAPVLHGEMWGPLRDLELFNQVSIDPIAHTLSWPNGADFDTETLHDWPKYKDELAARSAQRERTAVV